MRQIRITWSSQTGVKKMELVAVIKALADDTRIRILNLLQESELCVGEIERLLNLSQSNVSRHLARLKSANVIICEKRGQRVHYRLNKGIFKKYPFIQQIIDAELNKIEQCIGDIKKLREYQQEGSLICSSI